MSIYCVYITFYRGNKLPPFYIGSTSVERVDNGYHGTVKSKEYKNVWINEIKNNPQLFKTKIISIHADRKDATYKEYKLQKLLNVVKSKMYINKSLAAPNGFFGMDISGKLHWGYKKTRPQETRDKISINHHDVSGSNNPRARKIKLSSPQGIEIISIGNLRKTCTLLGISFGTMFKLLKENHTPKTGVCVGWKIEYVV